MYKGLELISDALCIVGESPLWDAHDQQLLYLDIQGKRMRRINWLNGIMIDTVLPQQFGFIVQDTDGNIIGGGEHGIYRIDFDGNITMINHTYRFKGARINDGKVGPDGRLYFGTFSRDYSAAFYKMETDGSITELLNGIGNSNGLDWDPSNHKMYYNDTPSGRTDAFIFNGENGTLSNRKTLYTYSEGCPDGMTCDTKGNLWVALWGGKAVVCVRPDDGTIIRRIDLPVSQVACCAFAGNDLRDLVITTAAHGIHLKDEPLAGATFKIHVEAEGKNPYCIHTCI